MEIYYRATPNDNGDLPLQIDLNDTQPDGRNHTAQLVLQVPVSEETTLREMRQMTMREMRAFLVRALSALDSQSDLPQ